MSEEAVNIEIAVTESVIADLFRKAMTDIPQDVERAFLAAYEGESSEVARVHLRQMMNNVRLAREESRLLCVDTGVLMAFLAIGRGVVLQGGIQAAETTIRQAAARITHELPLTPMAVNPFSWRNSGDNVGVLLPDIHTKNVPAPGIVEITVASKGGGSELGSALRPMWFADGLKGLKKFVLHQAASGFQRGKTCPPNIVGVGLGGTAAVAMRLATQAATLRPVESRHPEPTVGEMELELIEAINALGYGPQGMGGRTSILDLHVEYASSHAGVTAMAVSFQCAAARRATIVVDGHGTASPRPFAQAFVEARG